MPLPSCFPLRSPSPPARRQAGHGTRTANSAAAAALLACGLATAQTSPAHGPIASSPGSGPTAMAPDRMPLADYLALLHRLSPAAEAGARTYLAAVRLRCGSTLDTPELRRALSEGDGDPVLIGLIRAAQLQDTAARQRLVSQLRCPPGAAR